MKKGFTLIELLVVIAIVGILAGAVVVAINPTARMNEAQDAKRQSVLVQLAEAMEACYVKKLGAYTDCDTAAKLLTANFIKADPTVVGGTWVWGAANGCISVTSAVSAAGCTHYRYATPGPIACGVTC